MKMCKQQNRQSMRLFLLVVCAFTLCVHLAQAEDVSPQSIEQQALAYEVPMSIQARAVEYERECAATMRAPYAPQQPSNLIRAVSKRSNETIYLVDSSITACGDSAPWCDGGCTLILYRVRGNSIKVMYDKSAWGWRLSEDKRAILIYVDGSICGGGNLYGCAMSINFATGKERLVNPRVQHSGFKSPSDNIHCLTVTYEDGEGETMVSCEIAATTGAPPLPMPSYCRGDWGKSFSIASSGIAVMHCPTDSIRNDSNPTLNYGSSISIGKITCSSSKRGIECKNADSHGYFLSKTIRRIF